MNFLIIDGYPGDRGLSKEIALKYKEIKEKNNEVRFLEVNSLKFDLILKNGYKSKKVLEPDLIKAQKEILWAERIVFIFPIWWGGIPSQLKAFIERVFLPGFAFRYENNKPKKLLKGKTLEIIGTAGGPKWYYKTLGIIDQRRTLSRLMNFCGIKTKKILLFGRITPHTNEKYLDKIFIKIEK